MVQTSTLDKLIELARHYKMTDAEKREQRRSFVYANCHLDNELITREMVDEADEKLYPRGASDAP